MQWVRQLGIKKKNVPALLRRRQMVLLPRHKHPNLAVRFFSELSTIVNVVTWHFVRNGRWHPTAIGCGRPPASKSTFGRRSPLDVSMSKTVTAQWIHENIFKCNQHIDRYYHLKKHQQQQSSTFLDLQHMSDMSFRTKKSTCLAKNTTPRIHLPLPIHSRCLKAMLHWGSLGVVYRSNSSMDGCLETSVKNFPKESDLKCHHSCHTHSKAIEVSLPFTIATPRLENTLLWWWAAKTF